MDSSPPTKTGEKTERRPRRDKRRARNRQRLLDATIDIILEEGTGGLTMAHIAKRAGVRHSTFYAHFKNVDECIHTAVLHVARINFDNDLMRARMVLQVVDPDDEANIEALEEALRLVVKHARIYLLFFRCYFEPSPMGQATREQADVATSYLADQLWQLGIETRLEEKYRAEVEIIARFLINCFVTTAVRVIGGGPGDVRDEATRLYRYSVAILTSEFKRMHEEQNRESTAGSSGSGPGDDS